MRLQANKTSLYKLVSEFEILPPQKYTDFTKIYRRRSYVLLWHPRNGNGGKASLSAVGGACFLTIERSGKEESISNLRTFKIAVGDLQARGMIEIGEPGYEKEKAGS